MKIRKAILSIIATVMLASTLGNAAVADERGRGRERERHEVRHEAWRGDIRVFHEHDYDLWRGGRWLHVSHGGRLGWWWVVGGAWYFYPTPVYPYPDPYQPPVVVVTPAPAAPQYWYYCSNPQGYYPYVPQCPTTWQRVPAQPAVAANPSPPAPSAPPVQQNWYYCQNPQGYYPTVPQCPGGWQQVPATTPPR